MLHFSEQIWMKFECLTAFDLLKHDDDLPENAVYITNYFRVTPR